LRWIEAFDFLLNQAYTSSTRKTCKSNLILSKINTLNLSKL
jgi:uncharacterized protein (DUF927 family)